MIHCKFDIWQPWPHHFRIIDSISNTCNKKLHGRTQTQPHTRAVWENVQARAFYNEQWNHSRLQCVDYLIRSQDSRIPQIRPSMEMPPRSVQSIHVPKWVKQNKVKDRITQCHTSKGREPNNIARLNLLNQRKIYKSGTCLCRKWYQRCYNSSFVSWIPISY